MINLRKLSSFNSLKYNSLSGQLATILILLMVVTIVFILVTLNMGEVSFKATALSNTVDSGVLYLASQLASRAHYFYHALGDSYSHCVRGGLLAVVLAVVFAVVALVITICCPPVGAAVWNGWALYLASAGIVIGAGAAGGAIGNVAIQGDINAAGAGAIMGAKIGLAVFMIGGPDMPIIPVVNTSPAIIASKFTIGPEALAILNAATYVGGIGAIAYNTYAADRRVSKTMSALNRQLNGLPEYESMREGVFLNVLDQAVDDPTMTDPGKNVVCGYDTYNEDGSVKDVAVNVPGGDPLDLNENGNFNDKISCFEYWWYNHVETLKASIVSYRGFIDNFFTTSLIPFYERALDFRREIDRWEQECDCNGGVTESHIVNLFRAIHNCGYPFFWQPGASRGNFNNYLDCPDEGSCSSTPGGWDDLDSLRMNYDDFLDDADALLKPACGLYYYDTMDLDKKLRDRSGGAVSDSWDWFDHFYHPSDGDYHSIFTGLSEWLLNWRDSVVAVRDSLPGCKLSYNTGNTTAVKQQPTAIPYCDGDTCNWNSTGHVFTGPYFPNPICKIYPADKAMLLNQITVSENAVNAITPAAIAASFAAACGACDTINIVIGPVQFRLVSNPAPAACSAAALGTGAGRLQYNFNFSYTCRCCNPPPACVTAVDSNIGATAGSVMCSPSGGCCNTSCTSWVWTTAWTHTCSCVKTVNCNTGCGNWVFTPHAGNVTRTINIAAPDLNTGWMTKANLLVALGQMRNYINDPKVTDTFATQDADNDDEFQPVLDLLQDQSNQIMGVLMPGIEQLYNDLINAPANNRAKNGAGSITYTWTDTGCPQVGGVYQPCHSVKVDSGPFEFAYLYKTKSGNWLRNKKCQRLGLGDDKTGERTWLEVTRTDPSDKAINSSGTVDLGLKWNPVSGGPVIIKRKSKAYYTPTNVSLSGVK